MATSFKKTVIKSYPRVGDKVTSDTLYWQNLDVPVTKKEYGTITNVDFSPVQPYNFAVTNSTRVQIYHPQTLQIVKTFSRFKEVAFSGSFRNDGNLLVAGGDEGVVRVFDVMGKTLLRVLKGHKGSVHVAKFLSDNIRVVSAGDDKSVKIWDVPSETVVRTYCENEDYIRCGVSSKSSKDIFVTGSYDHTVKLFDSRTETSVLTIDHGCPVESVLLFPHGSLIVSAGGTVVKVWDALAGGKLMTQMNHHHKTVTSLCLCSNNARLMSASLDRHIKIYDIGTYQCVHTLDYAGSILSIGVSPDDELLVVGTVEGLVSIQKRKAKLQENASQKRKKVSFRYSLAGKTYLPHKDDIHVHHKRKEHLPQFDKLLKAFKHGDALDAALELKVRTKNPEVTVSVIVELMQRGNIKQAIAGRDEKTLQPLIRFLAKNISSPKFMNVLIDVANITLDLYASQIGNSSILDDLLLKLKAVVDREVEFMKQLMKVLGTLDVLFSGSPAIQVAPGAENQDIRPSHDTPMSPSSSALTL